MHTSGDRLAGMVPLRLAVGLDDGEVTPAHAICLWFAELMGDRFDTAVSRRAHSAGDQWEAHAVPNDGRIYTFVPAFSLYAGPGRVALDLPAHGAGSCPGWPWEFPGLCDEITRLVGVYRGRYLSNADGR